MLITNFTFSLYVITHNRECFCKVIIYLMEYKFDFSLLVTEIK